MLILEQLGFSLAVEEFGLNKEIILQHRMQLLIPFKGLPFLFQVMGIQH